MILNGSNDPLEIFWRHLTYPYATFNLHCGSGTVGVCDPFIFLVISNSGNETPSGGVGWIPRKGIAGDKKTPPHHHAKNTRAETYRNILKQDETSAQPRIVHIYLKRVVVSEETCNSGEIALGEAALTIPSLHRLGIECLLLHCRSPCRSYLPFGLGRSRPKDTRSEITHNSNNLLKITDEHI